MTPQSSAGDTRRRFAKHAPGRRLRSGAWTPVALVLMLAGGQAGNIDPQRNGFHFAYGENVGWFNFDAVTVTDRFLTGFVWGENVGWINLLSAENPDGVRNDGRGNLNGWAWGENVGWIRFDHLFGGVSIDAEGVFRGFAWGENIGWLNFGGDTFGVRTSWRPSEPFRRGDANGDGSLDISDPVRMLLGLFVMGIDPQCSDASDSNDDGNVDVGDPVYLLNFLFRQGLEPPAPGPLGDCGGDPTQDDLFCGSYGAC